jgi:hypothetical protein
VIYNVDIRVPDKSSPHGCRVVSVKMNSSEYKQHLSTLRDEYAKLVESDKQALEIAKRNVDRYQYYVDFYDKEMEKL